MDELTAAWLTLNLHVNQLASERQYYLEFFERADDAYLLTTPAGTILEANGAAVDLLNRRRKHLRGKPLAVFFRLEDRAAFRVRVRAVSGNAPAAWQSLLVLRGKPVAVEMRARAVRGSGQQPRGLCWRLRRAA